MTDTVFLERGGGGGGLSRVWIFYNWTFQSRTYHVVHGRKASGQNTGQNCKAGQNAGHFWNRETKCQSYQII